MNPTGVETLVNPKPCGHIVYPYTDESQVAEAVCLFAGAGLQKGEAVLLVMTAAHREPIRQRLEQQGFNLQEMEASGQLVCADALSLLSTFLFDGIVDEHRFKSTVGGMIEKAKSVGGDQPNRSVRVFGEMVDLMWKTHLRSTERLEQLWNEVVEAHAVPLLCAYSLSGVKSNMLPTSLYLCHSHAVA
jgi:hypothetical protein